MAERSISLPETPKSNDTNASNSRRYSIGKPREKAVPNYLRASTGSCHDLCKYGKNHEFEAKAKPPFLRRKVKKPPDEGSSSHSLPEDDIVVLVKHKPKSNPKLPEVSPISLNRRTVVSNSGSAANKMPTRQNPVSTEVQAKNKAAARQAFMESSKIRVERTNSLAPNRKQTAAGILTKSVDSKSSISVALENKQTSARKLLAKSIDSGSSITGEFERRKKASAIKLRTSLDSKTDLSCKTIKQDVPLPSGKVKASLKQVSSKFTEPPVSSKRASSSLPDDSSSISRGLRNSYSITGEKTMTSKIAAKGVHMSPKPTLKVQLPSKALLSPKTSGNGIASKLLTRFPSLNTRNHKGSEFQSPILSQHDFENEHQPDPDLEKTLYVVEMETDCNENLSAESSSPPLLPAKSPPHPESSMSSSHNEEDEEESEFSMTDIEDDDSVSEYDETGVEHNTRDRKTELQHLEDKDGQPFKLRFRQGRVIEMQPEHNTPRRLKFRKGRSIAENQNLKSDGRRSFKRRGADGNANDGNSNSETVVLRHQDAHGKKDAQGLFNNVIEETASKLVETRKSKVKALVGAFETVISLQDGKPTANTAS